MPQVLKEIMKETQFGPDTVHGQRHLPADENSSGDFTKYHCTVHIIQTEVSLWWSVWLYYV
jgi:hypothetical protein